MYDARLRNPHDGCVVWIINKDNVCRSRVDQGEIWKARQRYEQTREHVVARSKVELLLRTSIDGLLDGEVITATAALD